MTIDDLQGIFATAHGARKWADGSDAQCDHAGLVAVVEALRDEMLEDMALHTSPIDSEDVSAWFNEILGENCSPKDDGVLIGNQNVEAIINDLHEETK